MASPLAKPVAPRVSLAPFLDNPETVAGTPVVKVVPKTPVAVFHKIKHITAPVVLKSGKSVQFEWARTQNGGPAVSSTLEVFDEELAEAIREVAGDFSVSESKKRKG